MNQIEKLLSNYRKIKKSIKTYILNKYELCYQFCIKHIKPVYDGILNKIDDFYVIAEIYRGEDGTDTKTGNLFAVNAYNQELYKLQVDESGRRYTLVTVSDI